MKNITNEQRDGLMNYIGHHGALHDDGCPCDDTCDCELGRINKDVQACCFFLHDAPARITLLERELAEAQTAGRVLAAVVDDALSPGVFGPWHTTDDPALHKDGLLDLCRTRGFGAVMHYVEYLWSKETQWPGSEHTCAACASVRRDWIKSAQEAMNNPTALAWIKQAQEEASNGN